MGEPTLECGSVQLRLFEYTEGHIMHTVRDCGQALDSGVQRVDQRLSEGVQLFCDRGDGMLEAVDAGDYDGRTVLFGVAVSVSCAAEEASEEAGRGAGDVATVALILLVLTSPKIASFGLPYSCGSMEDRERTRIISLSSGTGSGNSTRPPTRE